MNTYLLYVNHIHSSLQSQLPSFTFPPHTHYSKSSAAPKPLDAASTRSRNPNKSMAASHSSCCDDGRTLASFRHLSPVLRLQQAALSPSAVLQASGDQRGSSFHSGSSAPSDESLPARPQSGSQLPLLPPSASPEDDLPTINLGAPIICKCPINAPLPPRRHLPCNTLSQLGVGSYLRLIQSSCNYWTFATALPSPPPPFLAVSFSITFFWVFFILDYILS